MVLVIVLSECFSLLFLICSFQTVVLAFGPASVLNCGPSPSYKLAGPAKFFRIFLKGCIDVFVRSLGSLRNLFMTRVFLFLGMVPNVQDYI